MHAYSGAVMFVLLCTCSVMGEKCTFYTDCKHETCVNGTETMCQFPTGVEKSLNGGLCTCADTQCGAPTDCFSNLAPNLKCHNSMRHCYDRRCLCDQYPTDNLPLGPGPIG